MHVPQNPVPYSADVETVADDEAQTIAELRETVLKLSQTMLEHTGHAMRSVHAKSFGLLRGTLEVLPGLPSVLAQGLFANPGRYDVVLRFSTPPSEQLDDRVSLPRAVALKVLDVPGERLPGSESDRTQDFLMVDGPVFVTKDAKSFAQQLKLLSATTDRAEGGKRMLSVVLRGVTAALGAVGVEAGALQAMGGHAQTHPLGATYFTQAPLRYGDYIAKLSLAPVSPSLLVLIDEPLPEAQAADANGLRAAVQDFFAAESGEWELRAQLNTDLQAMPIEAHDVEWSQADSPYVPVARLRVEPQPGWNEARSRMVDDGMSFNPWHGVQAHQPLGGVMRARRQVYPESVAFRSATHRCPILEPMHLAAWDAQGDARPD